MRLVYKQKTSIQRSNFSAATNVYDSATCFSQNQKWNKISAACKVLYAGLVRNVAWIRVFVTPTRYVLYMSFETWAHNKKDTQYEQSKEYQLNEMKASDWHYQYEAKMCCMTCGVGYRNKLFTFNLKKDESIQRLEIHVVQYISEFLRWKLLVSNSWISISKTPISKTSTADSVIASSRRKKPERSGTCTTVSCDAQKIASRFRISRNAIVRPMTWILGCKLKPSHYQRQKRCNQH